MTTFQAIFYAALSGFLNVTPIHSERTFDLVQRFLGWPRPEGFDLGLILLGCSLSLVVYFRHEWLAMIAGLIRVIALRQRPASLDERTPLFLLLAWAPPFLLQKLLQPKLDELSIPSTVVLGIELGLSIFLLFYNSRSRKNKALYHLQWFHLPLIIILQMIAMVCPGEALMLGFIAILLMNFSLESAGKFVLYLGTLSLFAACIPLLHEARTGNTSTLSSIMSLGIAFFAGLLGLGGLTQQMERRSIAIYAVAKTILTSAALIVLLFWTT